MRGSCQNFAITFASRVGEIGCGTLKASQKIIDEYGSPETTPAWQYADVHYLAGLFYEAQGNQQQMIWHLREAARSSWREKFSVFLCYQKLRELGEKPHLVAPYFAGLNDKPLNQPEIPAVSD